MYRFYFLLLMISFALLNNSCKTNNESEKPNIIFIYADDLDFDQFNISYYPVEKFPCITGAKVNAKLNDFELPEGWDPLHFENEKIYTPNLQALADQGAHFTRFYITSPMCTPSRYSLLTGKYASRSSTIFEGVEAGETASIEWNQYLTSADDNIARQLKQAGYYTAITGKWHNGEPEDVDTRAVFRKYRHDTLLLNEKMKEAQIKGCNFLMEDIGFDLASRMSFGNADREGGHNLHWHTEGVLNFLDQTHDKPFFLYFPLPVPHGVGGGANFPVELTLTAEGYIDNIPDAQTSIEDAFRRIKENGASERSINFTWIDDCVGAIMHKLKEKGLDENTILIFTSDHQSWGKFCVYEGARVLFLMKWPGKIEPGKEVDDIYANIDVLPTLLEVAGHPIPRDIDGKSFLGRVLHLLTMTDRFYWKPVL